MAEPEMPPDPFAKPPGTHFGGEGGGDLPFESHEPFVRDAEYLIAGGVSVAAGMVPSPLQPGRMVPVLVFQFTVPDGSALPPLVLALEPEQLTQVPLLVDRATQAAIAGAANHG